MTEGACLVQIERLQKLWESFETNHRKLLLLLEELSGEEKYFKEAKFDVTEETYLDRLGQFRDTLLQLKRVAESGSSSASSHHIGSADSFKSKLPAVELPIFGGDLKDWVNFRETFTEMVVKDHSIANVYKLHYLKSSLKGEASNLLVDRSAASESFTEAWQCLLDYYNNNRLLITNLLSKFMSLKSMEQKSSSEVSRIRTNSSNILQALKVLGSPVKHWDQFVVFIIVGKLSSRLQRKWEEVVANSDSPTTPPSFESLIKFLEVERLALFQLESTRQSSSKSESSSVAVKRKPLSGSKGEYKILHAASGSKSKGNACLVCHDSHRLHECEAFKGKTPEERRKLVVLKQLCFNCPGNHRVTSTQMQVLLTQTP